MLLSGSVAMAQDDAVFPFDDAEIKKTDQIIQKNKGQASELTEAQKKEAEAITKEAVAVYEDMIGYDSRGKLEALQKTLAYITKKLESQKIDLIKRTAQLKALKNDRLAQDDYIQTAYDDEQERNQKLAELTLNFSVDETFLTTRIALRTKNIKSLEKRLSDLKRQIARLEKTNPGVKKGALSEYDLKLLEIDAQRQKDLQKIKDEQEGEALDAL